MRVGDLIMVLTNGDWWRMVLNFKLALYMVRRELRKNFKRVYVAIAHHACPYMRQIVCHAFYCRMQVYLLFLNALLVVVVSVGADAHHTVTVTVTPVAYP